MIPKNEKELSKTELSYTILLAASAAPMLFIDKMADKLLAIFMLTTVLLAINIYAYFRCRTDQKLKDNSKIRMITLLSLGVSFWMFLHALLMFSPSLNYKCFLLINRLSGDISDQTVYSSGAVSFFIASIALLIMALTEIIVRYKKIRSYLRSVYIIICSLCLYIIINYLILFPDILTAAPVVRLIYVNETIMVRPNQFWVLYHDGVAFEGNIETAPKKWYLDGELIGTENAINPLLNGKYYAEIETPKGIVKTKAYKHLK